MKLIKRLIPLVLLLALPLTAFAAGSVDPGRKTTLTIQAVYEKMPLEGMRFGAVRVASMNDSGELTVEDDFAQYREQLDIRGKNDAAWLEMAQVLELDLFGREEIPMEAVAKADENGMARFEGLGQGLYLILCEGTVKDGYAYTGSAFFVCLPEQDGNVWNYDVQANAKPQKSPVTSDYRVEKVWEDGCHPNERPASITVELLCDGEVYDTITLPEDGHWQHTWENLNVNCRWTVREKAVSGYAEPAVTKDGNVFTITNTCNKTTGGTTPGLPQTGQLWWPVPLLLLAGFALVVVGLIRRRNDET